MNLLVLLVAIALAFAASLVSSYALTRASGVGRLYRVDLAAVVARRVQPGVTFETIARVELVEFEGLQSPPALVLADGDAKIQAVAPEHIQRNLGVGAVCLLPTDPSTMTGTVRTLGTFRVFGSVDDLPLPHVRIRSIART